MVAALTTDQKNKLRGNGHISTVYLTVFVPEVLIYANTAADAERGDLTIGYDSLGAAGEDAFDLIEAGQTVIAYDGEGNELGRVRLKSITGDYLSGQIGVAENSIDWGESTQFNIYWDYQLWPVYPLINPAGTFFKDYNLDYTDQNEEPPPVAIAGSHRAGFITGTPLSITVNSSTSYAVANGATISSRLWEIFSLSGTGASFLFGGGTDSTLSSDVLVISELGQYWLKLTVADSNGKSQSTYRRIYAHSTDPSNEHYPYVDFNFERAPEGDWERGGWATRIRVAGSADQTAFPDGALILLWQKSSYGGTAGNISFTNEIIFAGYIRQDTTGQDWQYSQVSFEATTIDGLLRRMLMWSVSLTETGSPTKWYEYAPSLTNARALHHYWRWHSTLFQITDVFLPTGNTLRRKYADFEQGTLYDQADSLMRQYGIQAHICCNKAGQVYVETDIQLLDASARAAVTVIADITTTDRRDRVEIVRQPDTERPTALLHLSGLNWDGTTATPLIARAPGNNPETNGGQVKNFERQTLQNQDQANALAGRLLAKDNNQFKQNRIPFAGNYLGVLDIVPQAWWTMDLDPNDTIRGIIWADKRLVIRSVTCQIDQVNGVIIADGVAEAEAIGLDGVAGDYPLPTTPPTDPVEEPTIPPPDTPPGQGSGALLAALAGHGAYYLPPNSGSGWESRNGGITPANVRQLGFDPWWQTKQGSSDPARAIVWMCEVGAIYRSDDCGQNWTNVTPTDNPPNSLSLSPAPTATTVTYLVRTDNIHVQDAHYFLVTFQDGSDDWGTWLLKTTDDGQTWEWLDATSTPSPDEDGYYAPVAYDYEDTGSTVESNVDIFDDGYSDSNMACLGSNGTDGQFVTIWLYYPVAFVQEWDDLDILFKNYSSRDADGGSGFGATIYAGDGVDLFDTGRRWAIDTTHSWQERIQAITNTVPDAFIFDRLRLSGPYWSIFGSGTACLSTIAIKPGAAGIVAPGGGHQRAIWMDTDSEDGSRLYITVWKQAEEELALQTYRTSDLVLIGDISLGACTEAELNALTYVAYPQTPPFNKNEVYVYGRMVDPAGLSGTFHVIKSSDGGSTWVGVEGSWETDYCAAFIADWDGGGGTRQLTAVRIDPAAAVNGCRFYRGVDSLAEVLGLDGKALAYVAVDALTGSAAGLIAVGGAANTGGEKVYELSPPYTSPTGLEGDLPNSDIVSLIYL